MIVKTTNFGILCAFILIAALAGAGSAQGVKRIVIIKVDGLPAYVVDRFVKQRDPATGKSVLPWFDEIFYKHGSHLENFYTRGISLSVPSWGQLDTGQHLQIKGNVEYDRYTLHTYDYLFIVPYYSYSLLGKKVDMPAAEVLDQLKIPLLCDAFPYERRYTANQLYQRGTNWRNMGSGFLKLYPGNPKDFIDEWTLGLDFRNFTVDQTERDIIDKVVKRPDIDYFDYYDGSFDHVAHHTNDDASKLSIMKELDTTLGRIWVAIQSSSRADETAMVLLSDHGLTSEEKVYSQGFSLVKMLNSAPGGGHHVVTKRVLMMDYSIKGIYPFGRLIIYNSNDSYYLKGQGARYPTALLDFDGNERSSIHLRERELNILQILLQQLQRNDLSPPIRKATTDAFFQIVNEHRKKWQETVDQLDEELDALHRWREAQDKILATQPKKFTPDEEKRGVDKDARRVLAGRDIAVESETKYREYVATLTALLSLRPESFAPQKLKIQDLIAPYAMGEPNSVGQIQNYVIGLSPNGLTLNADQRLDLDKSFSRVNYFDLLRKQTVRNNLQPKLSNHPVDFVAARLSQQAVSDTLPADMRSNEDPIWLYGDEDKQALLLSRIDADGGQSFLYLPVAGLRQGETGKASFQIKEWSDDFPLKFFEDKDLVIPTSDRASWLSGWHTETEWLHATHKTLYSDAIIGLNEQLDRHPVFDYDDSGISNDGRLIRRFRQRQRYLAEADMLVLANNHWNFDVRGFNPGGNHGSFFRSSTNSALMIAGGSKTGIPRGLTIEEPYDGLSFVPTILSLMGKVDGKNRPAADLTQRGFKSFPGRVIAEFKDRQLSSDAAK